MASINIQGGTVKLSENTYKYEYEDTAGTHIFVFVAAPGESPVIGDFITDGVLVKRTEPAVNPDTSRWQTHSVPDLDVWGREK